MSFIWDFFFLCVSQKWKFRLILFLTFPCSLSVFLLILASFGCYEKMNFGDKRKQLYMNFFGAKVVNVVDVG